jgi:CRISPR type I-E-associated protein CasB/Cse2
MLDDGDNLDLFRGLLPTEVPHIQEETYYLIATLYPLAAASTTGNLGSALRWASAYGTDRGVIRRFEILMDSDRSQLASRLRWAIRLLSLKGAKVNWVQTLVDVLDWNDPMRSVQMRWARSLFVGPAPRVESDPTSLHTLPARPTHLT